ncbi:halocyanin [Halobacterium salinarum]|nr:halocyanin [Halobacterium salinarum]MCF2167458.1 halocyanin [Halobacterium salinarum]MCF2238851.1 halocyanin [Halobacterium salinarum]QRY23809.1 halocyanin [Halobacterium sp. GSL-19]
MSAMGRAPDRRTFLRSAVAGGLAAIAGCADRTTTGTTNQQPTTTHTETQPSEMSLHEWVASANTPESWTDHRSDATVSIAVSGHDLPYAFQPALTRVAPGTTVTWEWTGYGGAHNVIAVDSAFDSGDSTATEDHTFTHTFTEIGTHRYVSEPDRESGMKGIIAVEEYPTSGYPDVDRWLSSVHDYDGTVVTDTTTVTVGDTSSGSTQFDPLVLKVPEGTTVQWKWAGEESDGAHTVAFKSAAIGIRELRSEPGVHVTHTFNSTGTYRYFCSPHSELSGRGAVIVA